MHFIETKLYIKQFTQSKLAISPLFVSPVACYLINALKLSEFFILGPTYRHANADVKIYRYLCLHVDIYAAEGFALRQPLLF